MKFFDIGGHFINLAQILYVTRTGNGCVSVHFNAPQTSAGELGPLTLSLCGPDAESLLAALAKL